MSCGPEKVAFCLLDGYVGWAPSPATVQHSALAGLDADGGVLELALASPGAIAPADVDARVPPPSLARGCGPCEWFLVASSPRARLLRLGCGACFEPGPGPSFVGPLAVASRGPRVAVSDAGAGRVVILARHGEQVVGSIAVSAPGPIAFGERELFVAVAGEARLRRYDLGGTPLGTVAAPLPANGTIERLAVAGRGAIWIVVRDAGGALVPWRTGHDGQFHVASVADLAAAFSPTGVVVGRGGAFCLRQPATGPASEARCFDAQGACIDGPVVAPPGPPREPRGQLLTAALDSGIPRCRWHRVRVDADVPPGTRLTVDVATTDEPIAPPGQGVADPAWAAFDPGLVHPNDWQTHVDGPDDFLIQQPPGRWLFVRVRLEGDGFATPRVRRLRLDLPRSTSLEHLPAVYRETPAAEDFTERFLSLFDATIEEIDRSIVRAPALLDAGALPEGALPWLGAFLDITFDAQWTTAQRRALLAAAPGLYAHRGTRAGLADTLRIVTGADPAIIETALERRFGALRPRGQAPSGEYARLGGVRLFGRSRARFRVGRSAIGAARLQSFGNPDQDPLWEQAFRFQVLVPPQAVAGPRGRERLAQLIGSIKPAHTLASLRVGGGGFVVGVSSAVGADTILGGLPLAVAGQARLSRTSLVAPGTRRRRAGFAVGAAAVGFETVVL